jgi:hypothetical protein
MHYVGCDDALGFHNLCQFGGRELMKIDRYFLMQGVIIVFQVGLALLKYCEDDLVCFLTLI